MAPAKGASPATSQASGCGRVSLAQGESPGPTEGHENSVFKALSRKVHNLPSTLTTDCSVEEVVGSSQASNSSESRPSASPPPLLTIPLAGLSRVSPSPESRRPSKEHLSSEDDVAGLSQASNSSESWPTADRTLFAGLPPPCRRVGEESPAKPGLSLMDWPLHRTRETWQLQLRMSVTNCRDTFSIANVLFWALCTSPLRVSRFSRAFDVMSSPTRSRVRLGDLFPMALPTLAPLF